MLSLLATSYQVILRNSKYQLTIPRNDKMTKLTPITREQRQSDGEIGKINKTVRRQSVSE